MPLTNVAGIVTTYSNTGLTPATSYWYRGGDELGGASPASNVANTATVKATPAFTGLARRRSPIPRRRQHSLARSPRGR